MSLKIGIVGLPNVGKSTLFNALVKSSLAEAANYPFCTIRPNVGIVDIPDEKLPKLAEVAKSEKIVPAVGEFVDIAGLVRGASQGEGLGNKFLSHIREADAIILVLRTFSDTNIIHVNDEIQPLSDAQTIDIELMLADLATLTKRKETLNKDVRSGKEEVKTLSEVIDIAMAEIEAQRPLRRYHFHVKQLAALRELSLLTLKPLMIVLNVDDHEAGEPASVLKTKYLEDKLPYPLIPVSAKIESEISQLSLADAQELLASLNLPQSGLDRVANAAYALLGLQSYYTAGKKEARAWTIKQGSTAPQAAGVIHSDFERGFIAAEIMSYADFISLNGWSGGKAAGKVRTEGKGYVMRSDDVALFRFNV